MGILHYNPPTITSVVLECRWISYTWVRVRVKTLILFNHILYWAQGVKSPYKQNLGNDASAHFNNIVIGHSIQKDEKVSLLMENLTFNFVFGKENREKG